MRTITLLVHGLMVDSGQYKTLLWKESFILLYNASGPLDIPLNKMAQSLLDHAWANSDFLGW